MPYLKIILPQLQSAQKEALAMRLNDEFINATGFETETLFTQFQEYGNHEMAISGVFSNSENPYVCFHLYSPRLRHDVKRGVAAALSESIRSIPDFSGARIELYLHEFPYENLGLDGQLMTDADEELASRPFYYVLPR